MRPADSRPICEAENLDTRPTRAPRPVGDMTGSLEVLERALATLMEFTRDRWVPASVLVNPLLVVWDSARGIGPDVSGPVEALLTVAVQRASIGSDEVIACVQEVRAFAVQEAVLSVPAMG